MRVVSDDAPAKRKYDKGERRFKHVGKGKDPVIEFDRRDPKKWIGKCPSGIAQATLEDILNSAIEAPNGDRDLNVPKKVYAVYMGAVYEAQTSDGGTTYHGYPYRGKLSRVILSRLRAKAEADGYKEAFLNWVKQHIVRHGERK